VLAGRSAERLAPLARRLGLKTLAVGLEDPKALAGAVSGVPLVLHAAGPFSKTAIPMISACLKGRVHYLDISGELDTVELALSFDEEARRRGLAVLPAAGFDVVPTDCLAKHVADRLPGATHLEIAVAALGHASAGTVKTILEQISAGIRIRRAGRLEEIPIGSGMREVRFADRDRTVVPMTLADLATAHRATGIPNVTTLLALPKAAARFMRIGGLAAGLLLDLEPVRAVLQKGAGLFVSGPDEQSRQTGRTQIWARARDGQGREAQAWLSAPEAYQFTALSVVRSIERILDQNPKGAFTPAQVLGADFVLEIPETKRYDHL
jgi:short subunit dehydrogenase-like uncharacterized protein